MTWVCKNCYMTRPQDAFPEGLGEPCEECIEKIRNRPPPEVADELEKIFEKTYGRPCRGCGS